MDLSFWVKLLRVSGTANADAREDLYANCTHVKDDLWLFEGDEEALHEGITFSVLDEQAISCYGDMSQKEIIDMVDEVFVP